MLKLPGCCLHQQCLVFSHRYWGCIVCFLLGFKFFNEIAFLGLIAGLGSAGVVVVFVFFVGALLRLSFSSLNIISREVKILLSDLSVLKVHLDTCLIVSLTELSVLHIFHLYC
ncbi:hypothetical protein CHS0354_034765 [Potamilus streckersoni]|uniref:Uncharacterized protein n=1 Tax=Potamilus streckersoni TaxID=2493646 RepID=A0AAE0VJC0_9BIVA|nr:hypothetical protein CHS0354_034765 [Potamilus streckersoni]